jgi:hypothetical protein
MYTLRFLNTRRFLEFQVHFILAFLKVGQFLELLDTMKTESYLLALVIFTLLVLISSGHAEIKEKSRKFFLIALNFIAKLNFF